MAQNVTDPFAARLDPYSGDVRPEASAGGRRLSQMAHLFADVDELQRLVLGMDEIVYKTSTAPVPELEGHVGFNQTRIEAGDVAGEFFMTHGHIHVRDEGETYIGQSGRGGIILSLQGRTRWVPMEPNVVGYIPPGWTHRSVNVGDEPFVFISVYPALSGQNYEPVRLAGVGGRVFRTSTGYQVVDNDGHIIAQG